MARPSSIMYDLRIAFLLLMGLASCAGPDRIAAREPRTPAEEPITTRPPRVAPPAQGPEETVYQPGRTRSSRLAELQKDDPLAVVSPEPEHPRTRPIQHATDSLARLEGVWTYSRYQHPSGFHTHGVLEGYAIVCGPVMQYHVTIDEGQIDDLRRQILFEAGGFTLTPSLDGSIIATPRGGFGNIGEGLHSLPREGDPQRQTPEPYSAQSNPWTRDRTQDPPRWDSTQDPKNALTDDRVVSPLATRRRIYFLGDDLVRIEIDPDHYMELSRVVTDRLQAERHRAFIARARTGRGLSADPPPSRFEAMTPSAVLRHRERKRAMQGVWSVEEIVDPERTSKHEGAQGEFTFLDGYLLYRISYTDRTDLLGQTLTFFQIGLRRYVLTEHDEMVLEDVVGISNLTTFMQRVPPGRRSRHAVVFGADEGSFELRSSPMAHIGLRRVMAPRWVEEERKREREQEASGATSSQDDHTLQGTSLLERSKRRSQGE